MVLATLDREQESFQTARLAFPNAEGVSFLMLDFLEKKDMLRKYSSERSGVLDPTSTASSLDRYRVVVLYCQLRNLPKMPGHQFRWTSISSAVG